jgi:WD40 repeat protein
MTEEPGRPPPAVPETPYVGLVPFRAEDADFFFGRDEERRIVAANLRASRLTILYGPSGVGKTSLLQAGVVHDLRHEVSEAVSHGRPPPAVCAFRNWRDEPFPSLMDALQDSVCAAVGGSSQRRWSPAQSVVRTLRAWTRPVHRLLVVLDQFEDYFLYHGGEDGAGTLCGELPAIVNEPNLRVNVLLSIREDAWAKLDVFEGRIPRLFGNYLRVDHLSRTGARLAIEKPIETWNARLRSGEQLYTLEPRLVDAVLDAAASGGLVLGHGQNEGGTSGASADEIEAPYLQLVMDRLWRATVDANARQVTLERLTQLGGPQQIVETHLLDALEALSPGEQAVAADVFAFLVTRSKTKIAHPAADLAEWTKRPVRQVSAVLDKLSRAEGGRILRSVRSPDGESERTRYELFHDLLAEPILEWRRGYEEERARRAALRKFARIGGVLLALVAVFAALGVWALVQRDSAVQATRSATSLALASAATDEVARHPDVALLLGLEAYRASPSAEAASAMVDGLETARRSGAEAILRGDANGIRAIALSPDGQTLASADFDGAIQLWDTSARVPLGAPLHGHTAQVWSVAFSPDGMTLASASHDGTVRLWDVAARRALGRLPAPDTGAQTSLAFSPDGRTLAVGGEGGRLQLWDVRTRRPLAPPLRGHNDRVVSLAFSPDGRTLASAGFDHTVRLWDVRSRREIGRPLVGHGGPVASVAFSPDGRTLASSGLDGTIRLWDARTRAALGPPLRPGTGEIWGIAFGEGGRVLASAGFDGNVRLWNVRTRTPAGPPLTGHTDALVDVAFAPNGRILASAGYDGTIRIWDLGRHPLGFPLGRHAGRVTGVAFGPDGKTLASVGFDGALRLWAPSAERLLGSSTATGGNRSFEDVAISPDGRTIASADDDGSIELFDARARVRTRLPGQEGAVQTVSFGPDGHTLASAGDDGVVRLWDARTGTASGEPLRGHAGPIWSIAFSPDGRSLASAASDGTIRLWDVRRRTATARLSLPDSIPLTVAFSPDGRVLASGDVDGSVRLWEARALKPIGAPLTGHDGRVESIAFSPDGRVLASAGDDGTVRLWDLRGRRQLGVPLRGHEGAVFSVAFDPEGGTLASGGDDGTVRVWRGILWQDQADLRAQVCRLVVGNLTRGEWDEVAPGLAYRSTCPS